MSKLNSWAACLFGLVSTAAAAAELHPLNAYVFGETSSTVAIVDALTNTMSTTFKVGEKPRGIVSSPNGERVYVVLEDGTLSERDMFVKAESGQAKLGGSPSSIDVSPDGKLLAATIRGSAQVVLLDLARMRIAKNIPIRDGKRPVNAVFSPNGRWIYVIVDGRPALDVIDVRQGSVVSSIDVGSRLRDIAFAADSSRAYVTAEQESEVVVIDVARNAVLARAKIPSAPFDAAVQKDGKRVFVSTPAAGKVEVLDTGSNKVVAQIDACNGASAIALTPDGSKLFVTCGPAKEVAVIDTATSRRVAQVQVGMAPTKVVISEPPPPPEDFDRPARGGRRPS